MSSLRSQRKASNDHAWRDSDVERKSGLCAGFATLVMLVGLHAVLFVSSMAPVPVGEGTLELPLAMEIRRVPPPDVIDPEPVVKEETRKLIAEVAEPERHTVTPPPEPAKIEPVRPRPKRTPPPKKPEVRRIVEKTPPPEAVAESLGDSAGTGTYSADGVLSGSANTSPGVRNDILAALVRVIEANKRYPRNARRAGIEGSVALRVIIGSEGRVSGFTLERSCGKSVLDDAARELGNSLVGLDIPAARGHSMTVTIPVQYALMR